MMKNKETPWNFLIEKRCGSYRLKYSSLFEICQGGPEVGKLSINNKLLNEYLFGGPIICNGNFLILPLFIKSFFNSGFKICIIDLITLKVRTISKKKDLIILDRLEINKLYYYESIDSNEVKTLLLNEI
jgi:hypothetical protein